MKGYKNLSTSAENGAASLEICMPNPRIGAKQHMPVIGPHRSSRNSTEQYALCVNLFAIIVLLAGIRAAQADTLSTPAMVGPLAANPNPIDFDAGPLGTIYVTGVASGFALWQTDPYSRDRDTRWDLGNAQVIVQKTDGFVQFYVQAGQYDILALGVPTVSSSYFSNHEFYFTNQAFGFLPQAYLKLAPTDNFSVEAGKLPTLIGDEDTFSFQNPNIERGLGWNQTNGQTRGIQANYTAGPVVLNLSWNDGYYSNRFDSISGLATWTIDPSNTLAFLGAGNAGRSGTSTFITPKLQNNQDIFDLMYTRTQGPWMLQPYVQYSHVPVDQVIGIDSSGSTWAAALLAVYNLAPDWNLAGRAEYIGTSGGINLLDGPGSNAWSLTVTPTWQHNMVFVRTEGSYVAAEHTTAFETSFGANGTKSTQLRALIEVGIIF